MVELASITPGVCALAALARPTAKPSNPGKTVDCDKQESADRLERALVAEIESALAGNHTGFDAARLQSLEQELQPIFATLPRETPGGEQEGGLGYPAARYLLHQHFLRQRSWYVRGLNPAGDGREPPDNKEGLRSRVAGHLLEVMEKRAGARGLDVKMLAIFVATLEHLLHGDERERLKQAWAVHELHPDATTTSQMLISVLEVFMAHYVYISQKADSGYALTLAKALAEVSTIHHVYSGWPKMQDFMWDQVTKRRAAAGGKFSLNDAMLIADEVLLYFQEVSGAMCHDMERTAQSLSGGKQGRVKLSELRSTGDLFREPLEYLVRLGALDHTDGEPHVLMPNYMLGPSNCDGTTSFYDLCCPNACEGHKQQLENALMAAVVAEHVAIIQETAQQRLGSAVPAHLLEHLNELARGNAGKVHIHGLAFANWLHKVFPADCPRPREADFKGMAGDVLPDANRDFQATAKVDLFDW
eukprot:gb/GFBE01050949.1/.p1 GENE.gb/GFBE01050949.1/~~gb/GFBE01050949.1/.p1  ORF type:complete len:474 (+),score=113.97 gb/GFBE01050949.1/:1-1422(+)